jgi:hypothetical protein
MGREIKIRREMEMELNKPRSYRVHIFSTKKAGELG